MDLRLISLDHIESVSRPVRFPVLQEVLLSLSMSHPLRFLKFIQPTSVDITNLNIDDETCASDYNAIFTEWAYHNLSVIDSISPRCRSGGTMATNTCLTSLKLEILCTFDLDNAAINEIAMAWPLLETLDLSIRSHPRLRSRGWCRFCATVRTSRFWASSSTRRVASRRGDDGAAAWWRGAEHLFGVAVAGRFENHGASPRRGVSVCSCAQH